MAKRPGINMAKQDGNETALPIKDVHTQDLDAWAEDIKSICKQLAVSSDSFSAEKTYKSVEIFIPKHGRWLYSTVSTFLFDCDEQGVSTFISNLDGLRDYAYLQIAQCTPGDKQRIGQRKKLATAIDKLWDHSNLAQTQNQSLHDSDETFKARFDKNLIPFESKFAQEMNMQFISLIAIFTALSFLVFGGITSLDNIFTDIGHVPVLELMIVGCIWGLCITNLVFIFIYFVAKLTKLNIKSSDEEGATLAQAYPFFVWSNYLLVLILAILCWLYYIDYANAGSWLLIWSKDNSMASAIIGVVIITAVFGTLARYLISPPRKKPQIEDSSKAPHE